MKIVCISDNHNQHNAIEIPEGDMLIHTKDFSTNGTINEL
jgi:hypothetical protein